MSILHIIALFLFLGFGIFGMAIVLESWNKVLANLAPHKQDKYAQKLPLPQTKTFPATA